jgi:hypothetical protein
MKQVTVKLTIDQWQNHVPVLEDLAEAIHEVHTMPDSRNRDFDWYDLQPGTRQALNSGILFDICGILEEIQTQSRNQ